MSDPQTKKISKEPEHVIDGREYIARLADKDGEGKFAREVRAGAWDHRNDVARAIHNAKLINKMTFKVVI